MSSQETPLVKEILEKTCAKCGGTKPTTEFPINKNGLHGVGSWCKPCFSAYGRAKRLENLEHERARSLRWATKNKAIVIERIYEARKKDPERYREYSRKWRAQNPDKVRDYGKAKRRNRREAKNATEDRLTAAEWREVMAEHNGRCNYCGSRDDIQIDHVMPLSRGGLHNRSNVVPACGDCNNSKNASTVEEWLARKVGDVPCLSLMKHH